MARRTSLAARVEEVSTLVQKRGFVVAHLVEQLKAGNAVDTGELEREVCALANVTRALDDLARQGAGQRGNGT